MDAMMSGRIFKSIGCKCYCSYYMIGSEKLGSGSCERIIGV
jgi:hypothetical protein